MPLNSLIPSVLLNEDPSIRADQIYRLIFDLDLSTHFFLKFSNFSIVNFPALRIFMNSFSWQESSFIIFFFHLFLLPIKTPLSSDK